MEMAGLEIRNPHDGGIFPTLDFVASRRGGERLFMRNSSSHLSTYVWSALVSRGPGQSISGRSERRPVSRFNRPTCYARSHEFSGRPAPTASQGAQEEGSMPLAIYPPIASGRTLMSRFGVDDATGWSKRLGALKRPFNVCTGKLKHFHLSWGGPVGIECSFLHVFHIPGSVSPALRLIIHRTRLFNSSI